MAEPQVKIGKMENAPEWYGTPLDEIHFEWSREEEVELERWCEKIRKNIEEEEMTPMERWKATWEGKPKDRVFIECMYNGPYAARSLDSFADAIKPGDLYKRPKLHIMAHLATAARFKLDIINWYVICYAEELWGGNARMIEYGTPQRVGENPVKTLEDLQGIEVADPKKHGLYPGYLWGARECLRILKKYGADQLPLTLSFCGDPLGVLHLGMTGFGPGMVMVKKNQELFKAGMEKAAEWAIKFGKACKEVNPASIYMCSYMGAFPPKIKAGGKVIDNEWILDNYAKVGRAIQSHQGKPIPMYHIAGAPGWMPWLTLYKPHGAIGPDSFGGWWLGSGMNTKDTLGDFETAFAYCREHDIVCGSSIDDHTVLDGDMNAIEELMAPRMKIIKQHPKHYLVLGTIDYWTPQSVFDKTLEMAKKLGKF